MNKIDIFHRKKIRYILIFIFIIITIVFSIVKICGDENLPKRNRLKPSPIGDLKYLGTSIVESHPLILKEKKIIVETWRQQNNGIHEVKIAFVDQFDKKSYDKRKYIETPLKNHSLASAIVANDMLCIFAVNDKTGRTSIDRACLTNGIWTEVHTVYKNENKIFNVSIYKDESGYVILKEVDHIGVPFTMVFGKIKKVMDDWNFREQTLYGENKYTGGPSILYSEGWYYLLYLERFSDGYATRIARSKNLFDFEESDRLFLDFNNSIVGMPGYPDVTEQNASDPEIIEVDGKSIIFFTRGNQKYGGSLSIGYSDLPVNKLLKSFW